MFTTERSFIVGLEVNESNRADVIIYVSAYSEAGATIKGNLQAAKLSEQTGDKYDVRFIQFNYMNPHALATV